jgi:FKBP-type peptidyl-prolyl cis-trans isomerase
MKRHSFLVLCLLSLGLSSGARAQEIKINVPGQGAPGAAAPAAAPAKPAVSFSEAQLLEALGWAIAQQAQLDMLKLSKEQLETVQKGFALGTQEKELFGAPEKVGPVVDQWARKRFNDFIEELRKKEGPSAQLPPPAVVNFDPAGFTEAQITEALGWFVGQQAMAETNGMNKDQLSGIFKGMNLFTDGKEISSDKQSIGPAVAEFVKKRVDSYLDRLRRKGLAESQDFFLKLKDNKSVTVLPSGLRFEILKAGEGAYPKASDTVKVNYTGTLVSGKVFDKGTQEFPLDGVIPGWTEGIQKINRGGKIRLYVPPQLGYGDEGNNAIPPSSTLIFEVELLDFKATPGPASLGVAR